MIKLSFLDGPHSGPYVKTAVRIFFRMDLTVDKCDMAKGSCHIIDYCNINVHYFAILDAEKYRILYSSNCCVTESLYSVIEIFSHTIKQSLHHCHKILVLCIIKQELTSSFPFNIARSQYSQARSP